MPIGQGGRKFPLKGGKEKVGSLFEQVVKEMKGHPITLILVLIALGTTGLGYNTYARAEDVQILKASIEVQNKIQTCRYLSDKIDNYEANIRLLEKDDADEAWVIEKRDELRRLNEKYDSANCRSVNY